MLTLFAWIEAHWTLASAIAFGIDVLVLVVFLLYALRENEHAGGQWRRHPNRVDEHIGQLLVAPRPARTRRAAADAEAHGLMASGKWQGRYEQYGSTHRLLELDLHVHPNGVITGGGRDDVGNYELRGFLLPCIQIASPDASSFLADVRLVKYYRFNTGNPEENLVTLCTIQACSCKGANQAGVGVLKSLALGTWRCFAGTLDRATST